MKAARPSSEVTGEGDVAAFIGGSSGPCWNRNTKSAPPGEFRSFLQSGLSEVAAKGEPVDREAFAPVAHHSKLNHGRRVLTVG